MLLISEKSGLSTRRVSGRPRNALLSWTGPAPETLLAAQDQPEEVLADGIDVATVKATIKLELADAPDEAVGQTLGRYKLLEQIGEGGCGMVYVAWGKPAEVAEWKMKLSEFQPTTNVPEKNAQQP